MDRHTQQGSAMLFSLGIILLLSALGSSMLMRSINESSIGLRSANRQGAFFLAEAAVDHIINNLRSIDSSDITTPVVLSTGSYIGEANLVTGTTDIYQIDGHGTASGETRNVEVIVQTTGMSIFQGALFANDAVYLKKGAFTDSYDSRNGTYASQTPGSNGNIGTNSIQDDIIELKLGSAVNGQLKVGPGIADPFTAIDVDVTSVVTANPDVVSSPRLISMPPVDTGSLDCSGDLIVPASTVHTLYQADSPMCYKLIDLGTGASIEISGDVEVYAATLDVSQSLAINTTGAPTQLTMQIYTSNTVDFRKEGTFVGALYAPQSAVLLKKAVDFYGGVVANSFTIDKESQFHYDEALADTSTIYGQYDVDVLSWREL